MNFDDVIEERLTKLTNELLSNKAIVIKYYTKIVNEVEDNTDEEVNIFVKRICSEYDMTELECDMKIKSIIIDKDIVCKSDRMAVIINKTILNHPKLIEGINGAITRAKADEVKGIGYNPMTHLLYSYHNDIKYLSSVFNYKESEILDKILEQNNRANHEDTHESYKGFDLIQQLQSLLLSDDSEDSEAKAKAIELVKSLFNEDNIMIASTVYRNVVEAVCPHCSHMAYYCTDDKVHICTECNLKFVLS